jgi:hypothetical protein
MKIDLVPPDAARRIELEKTSNSDLVDVKKGTESTVYDFHVRVCLGENTMNHQPSISKEHCCPEIEGYDF